METTRADIVGELDNLIDELMLRLEGKEVIPTGDISPLQAYWLEAYIEKCADILYEVLEQNRPE